MYVNEAALWKLATRSTSLHTLRRSLLWSLPRLRESCTDLLAGRLARRGVGFPRRRGERQRAVAPAPTLYAQDGKDDLGAGRDQYAGVRHTVLPGADELVSFEDQNPPQRPLFDHAKLGYATSLAQLLMCKVPARRPSSRSEMSCSAWVLIRNGNTCNRPWETGALTSRSGNACTRVSSALFAPFHASYATPALTPHPDPINYLCRAYSS